MTDEWKRKDTNGGAKLTPLLCRGALSISISHCYFLPFHFTLAATVPSTFSQTIMSNRNLKDPRRFTGDSDSDLSFEQHAQDPNEIPVRVFEPDNYPAKQIWKASDKTGKIEMKKDEYDNNPEDWTELVEELEVILVEILLDEDDESLSINNFFGETMQSLAVEEIRKRFNESILFEINH